MANTKLQYSNLSDQFKLSSKIYWPIFIKSIGLTLKNLHVLILITLYTIAFYLGVYSYQKKDYALAAVLLGIFTLFISSTFYMIGQIVKTGFFKPSELFKSFKALYVRANLVLLFWYFIYILIAYLVITPISAIINGNILLYLVVVPMILLIFLVFNTFPEAIYASNENIDSLFIGSIKFTEKYWFVWIVPTLVIMLLLNLTDHRFTIMPTLGSLKPERIFPKIEDIAFYIRSLILTTALIFRGFLYTKLSEPAKTE